EWVARPRQPINAGTRDVDGFLAAASEPIDFRQSSRPLQPCSAAAGFGLVTRTARRVYSNLPDDTKDYDLLHSTRRRPVKRLRSQPWMAASATRAVGKLAHAPAREPSRHLAAAL